MNVSDYKLSGEVVLLFLEGDFAFDSMVSLINCQLQ